MCRCAFTSFMKAPPYAITLPTHRIWNKRIVSLGSSVSSVVSMLSHSARVILG